MSEKMTEEYSTPKTQALMRFVDGRMSEDDKLDLLDRMAEDPELSDRAEEYARQNNLLRALHRGLDVGDARTFCPSLQQQIVDRLHHKPIYVRKHVMALAASAAILALAGSFYWSGEGRWKTVIKPPELVEDGEVAAAAIGDEPAVESVTKGFIPPGQLHFPFVPRQLAENETTRQPAQPIQWFNGHMHGRSIRQPDLSSHGLQLVDVDVLTFEPTPALHLTYSDELDNPVELYAGLLSQELRAAFGLVEDGHISIHWRLGDLMFALIAPTDSPQLLNIVATVSAAVETVTDGQETETTPVKLIEPSEADSTESAPLDIAAPAPDQGTMVFVPIPRPSRNHGAVAVEPPQAVPPNPDETEAETL